MARYTNPHLLDIRRTLWDFFLWKTGYYKDLKPREKPPQGFVYPAIAPRFNRTEPSVLWIGHSSFLIEIDGHTLLIDPVWDNYCSPIPYPKLRRKVAPPIPLQNLPPIDFVLLSHNHYDHLEAKTVRYLKTHHPKVEWIVPAGLSSWFYRRGITKVRELKWWENQSFARISVTAVPAQHFSGRTLWDKNKTHWNGYVLETAHKRLYFTGDTGYNPYDFKAIGDRWRGMDLSLIPIGTYVPKKFMQPVHISPEEAVQIHRDVHSRLSIGMHWKTFRLSDEPLDAPPYHLYLAMKEKNLPYSSFLPVDPGIYVNW
jgi:N-acyl-phosphatidylethanolamine-hydrolysing phospholipase D